MLRFIAFAPILSILIITIPAFTYAQVTQEFPPQPPPRPVTNATIAPTPTVSPITTTSAPTNITTVPPHSTTNATTPTSTSQPPPPPTTPKPKPSPNITTTATATPATSEQPTTPVSTTPIHYISTMKPDHPSDRKFDAFSFLGGFSLGLGLVAIGFLSWKFYMSRQENVYHTL